MTEFLTKLRSHSRSTTLRSKSESRRERLERSARPDSLTPVPLRVEMPQTRLFELEKEYLQYSIAEKLIKTSKR